MTTKPGFGGFTTGKFGAAGGTAKKFIPDQNQFVNLKTLVEQKFYPGKVTQTTTTSTFAVAAKPKEQPVQEVKLDFDQLLRQKPAKRDAFNQLHQNITTNYLSNPPLDQITGRVINWQLSNPGKCEVTFQDEIDFNQLKLEMQQNQFTQIEQAIYLDQGMFQIQSKKCPSLNVPIQIKMYGIQGTQQQIKEVVLQQGWEFGVYFEEQGFLVFRKPRDV